MKNRILVLLTSLLSLICLDKLYAQPITGCVSITATEPTFAGYGGIDEFQIVFANINGRLLPEGKVKIQLTLPPGLKVLDNPPTGFPASWDYNKQTDHSLIIVTNMDIPVTLMGPSSTYVFDIPVQALSGFSHTNGNWMVNLSVVPNPQFAFDLTCASVLATGTVSVPNVPLPIDLESFTAQEADCQVALEWTTASERNNAYFSIERSVDGRNFEAIHKTNGAGDSYERITYNYVDESPLTGKNLYRIRQVDFDGQSTSSLIEAVNINCNNSAINIYPNPTKNVVYVNGLNAGNVVEVYNVVGQLVVSKTTESQQEIISLNNLAAGMYQVKVLSNNQVIYNGKVVKSN